MLLKHRCGLSHGAGRSSRWTTSSVYRLKYKRSFENESNTWSAKGRDCGGKESLSSEGVKESKRVIKGTLPNPAGRNVDY